MPFVPLPVAPALRHAIPALALGVVTTVSAAQQSREASGPSAAPRTTTSHGHSLPVPVATAAVRNGPITIDGKLDDAAWAAAEPITQFTQFTPVEGAPPTERTEVRILYDDDALYVAARMWDKDGRKGVKSTLVRRDDDFNSDWFQLVIDSYHDHLSRAFFQVNPSGSKQDQIGLGTSCCDSGWDPVWEVATRIDDQGWTAEIRIPLSQLRFSSDPDQTWGIQIRRWIHRRQEEDDWSFWKNNENGGPSRFGHLEGLHLAKAGARQLELLPYAVGKGRFEQHDVGDPFNTGHVGSARVGLDLKYLLTSNLTLNATLNPDFGQVEVDPAVVNLSAFETFFPEKRPFFIEGSGVFSFGNFSCMFCSNVSSLSAFYSRRVGRAPTGADLAYNAGPYADVPDAATILGAAKVTGRTQNGYTIGVLDAVTGEADARVQTASGSRLTQEVEPLSNYFVGRIKKDFDEGNLVLGGVATSVTRQLNDQFRPRLSEHAEFLGGDFQRTWANKMYTLTGQYALSSVEGDARVIAAKEQSSARYYQRPDRARMSNGFLTNAYDTTLTALRGLGGYTRVAKEAGVLRWEAMVNFRTPGFETNDYAFQQTSDYVLGIANVGLSFVKPTEWYQSLFLVTGTQANENFGGDLVDQQVHGGMFWQTRQFWMVNLFGIWKPDLLDDRLLRGGPLVTRPGSNYASLNVSTDSRNRVVGNFGFSYSTNVRGGWGTSISAGADMRPASNILLSFNPSWNDSHALLQYVQSVADPTATSFYGNRYVLAAIKQKALGLDTRLNVTFSPTMTLQLYAQPFFATGDYFDFKEYTAPRSASWGVYGRDRGTISATGTGANLVYTVDPDGAGPAAPFTIDNPNFNFRSLRGNAVFRWEYLPGSTLYVAWTHSRSDEVSVGDFDFARDRNALFADKPDNIFLVKASWWIAR